MTKIAMLLATAREQGWTEQPAEHGVDVRLVRPCAAGTERIDLTLTAQRHLHHAWYTLATANGVSDSRTTVRQDVLAWLCAPTGLYVTGDGVRHATLDLAMAHADDVARRGGPIIAIEEA